MKDIIFGGKIITLEREREGEERLTECYPWRVAGGGGEKLTRYRQYVTDLTPAPTRDQEMVNS